VSVSGSQAVVLMEDGVDSLDAGGELLLQLGSVIKMPAGSDIVFGLISALSIPIPARDPKDGEMKIMEVELLGESRRAADGSLAAFRRGLSSVPGLGAPIFAVTPDELRMIYVRPSLSTARIGAIHQDRSLPALIGVNDLLGKHFAVIGATGSGKSCAVTLILHAILDKHPNGHVLLLDPHNEYATAFGDTAEVIGPTDLQLPFWLFNFEEFCEVLVNAGARIGNQEGALLNELIPVAKRQFLGTAAQGRLITADTPSPYRMTLIAEQLEEVMGRLDKPESLAPYHALKGALNLLMNDVRFSFMFRGGIAVRDTMAPILSRLLRLPVAGKPITILDLSAIPSEILNVVVSVLCRLVFDFAMWSEGAVPILMVCEEAHRYAPEDPRTAFEPAKRALSRIAKEGRKYGLSLCVATQRPAELAAGMLSQCNTIFAMRLTHQKDQDLVRAAMTDAAFGLLEALSSLGNAEAIAVGEGIAIPMRLVFDELPPERRPKSTATTFTDAWKDDRTDS
ncbi:MAG: ATP-binding protein, partial [Dongiaceae bacterium]